MHSQRIGWWTVTSLVPSGNVASTCTSWIISANALHHLGAGDDMGRLLHQVGNRTTVAGTLDDIVGDQCDGFGMIELDAPLQPLARHDGRHGDQQLVFLAWRELHEFPSE